MSEEFSVITEKMIFGGYCIAKHNGKNIFVPYAIPGEKLKVKIVKTLKDYDLAQIVSIQECSPHRCEPFCKLYTKCGGCNMQHIKNDYQIELRKQMLKDCFEREGLTCPQIEVISGSEKNYRCRIQLTDGGFNEKESNKIIDVDFCPVATEEINSYLSSTPTQNRPKGRVHFFGDKRLTKSKDEGFFNLMIADESKNSTWETKITGKKKPLKSKVKKRFMGTIQNEQNICKVNLCGKNIEFDVKGFFQSNMEVLEKTICELKKNIGGTNLLDMYCGAGTLSAFVAESFKKTFLVEHNRDALVHAEINIANTPHETYGLSGTKWVEQNADKILLENGAFDAVIIDPPRSGMESAVCKWLCKNKAGIVKSLSCDPSTHARDAKYLVKSGYNLAKLYLLDFYPQTSHIESLAYFES